MDPLAASLPLRFPPVIGFVAGSLCASLDDAQFHLLRTMTQDKGGRVHQKPIDAITGGSLLASRGARPGATSGRSMFIGRPGPRQPFVAATGPCATEEEAWAELAFAMALHQPGRLLASRDIGSREVDTSLGRCRRRDTFEAREIGGGVQLFIMTASQSEIVAQSRIYDATGRAPRVFASPAEALDFARWYRRRFALTPGATTDTGGGGAAAALETKAA